VPSAGAPKLRLDESACALELWSDGTAAGSGDFSGGLLTDWQIISPEETTGARE